MHFSVSYQCVLFVLGSRSILNGYCVIPIIRHIPSVVFIQCAVRDYTLSLFSPEVFSLLLTNAFYVLHQTLRTVLFLGQIWAFYQVLLLVKASLEASTKQLLYGTNNMVTIILVAFHAVCLSAVDIDFRRGLYSRSSSYAGTAPDIVQAMFRPSVPRPDSLGASGFGITAITIN
jgi:hypothetical protein